MPESFLKSYQSLSFRTALLFSALTLTACGGGSSSPATNPPVPPVPPAGGGASNSAPTAQINEPFTVRAIVGGQTIELEGEASDPEDGNLTGSALRWNSDLEGELGEGAVITTVLSFEGEHDIALTATDSGGSADTANTNILVLEENAVLEALLLGTGPLIPQNASFCPFPGVVSAFPSGTAIRIVVSDTLTEAQRADIENNLPLVAEASNGALSATMVSTANIDPLPAANEVTVTVGTPPANLGCLPQGCTILTFNGPGVITAARVVLPDNQLSQGFAHDVIGHGIFGLCHIDGNQIGNPRNSLMSFGDDIFTSSISGTLTGIDSLVIGRYFASGLQPGATRQDLVNAGLLSP
ncbi:hypothetical protein ACVBEJ_14130 [Porticoccus sp. GXU_MW_L64]